MQRVKRKGAGVGPSMGQGEDDQCIALLSSQRALSPT